MFFPEGQVRVFLYGRPVGTGQIADYGRSACRHARTGMVCAWTMLVCFNRSSLSGAGRLAEAVQLP